eukprot:COSAG04_NODE_1318_length_7243_cov_8.351204_7_plen_54_part_00
MKREFKENAGKLEKCISEFLMRNSGTRQPSHGLWLPDLTCATCAARLSSGSDS